MLGGMVLLPVVKWVHAVNGHERIAICRLPILCSLQKQAVRQRLPHNLSMCMGAYAPVPRITPTHRLDRVLLTSVPRT